MPIQRLKKIFTVFCIVFTLAYGAFSMGTAMAIPGETAVTNVALAKMLLEGAQKLFKNIIIPAQGAGTSNTITAIGKQSDRLAKDMADLFDKDKAFQTAAPPHICRDENIPKAMPMVEKNKTYLLSKIMAVQVDTNVNTKNTFAHVSKRLKRHKKLFCGKQDNACKPGDLANADISAFNFNKPAYQEEEYDAAKLFIDHLTNPIPHPPLPNDVNADIKTEAQAIQLAEAAALAFPQETLNWLALDSIQSESLGPALKKKSASANEIRAYEAQKRYNSPAWLTETASENASPYAAIKDMAVMMALILKQNNDMIELKRRELQNLSVLVSLQSRNWSAKQYAALAAKLKK